MPVSSPIQRSWLSLQGLSIGDADTNCAIVGGIVALSAPGGIPAEWLARREPLDAFLD